MNEVICPFKVTECDHYCGLHTKSGCSLKVLALSLIERKEKDSFSLTPYNPLYPLSFKEKRKIHTGPYANQSAKTGPRSMPTKPPPPDSADRSLNF